MSLTTEQILENLRKNAKVSSNTEYKNQQEDDLFAKILSTENVTVRHKNVSTASFDTKNRILTLPNWKSMDRVLRNFLVCHEVGHALFTPDGDGWKNGIFAIDSKRPKVAVHYLNVVEDARIERSMKRRFPGSRRTFGKGYENLHNRDFFKLNELLKSGRKISDFSFIDRLNIYTKVGAFLNVEFSESENLLVKKVESCRTWKDTVKVAKEIYEYEKNDSETDQSDHSEEESESGDGNGESKESKNQEKQKNKNNEKSDSNDDSEDSENDDSEDSEDSDGEDSENGEGSDESDDGEESESKSTNGSSDDEDSEDSDVNSDDDNEGNSTQDLSGETNKDAGAHKTDGKEIEEGEIKEVPDSETQKNAEEFFDSLIDQTALETKYANFPEVDYKKFVVNYKKLFNKIKRSEAAHYNSTVWDNKKTELLKNFYKFQAEIRPEVNYLVQKFEQRKSADEHSRIKVSKTGIIDCKKLWKHKISDDIFLRHETVREGKSHSFVMFLDWSSSMNGCMHDTIKQLICLTEFSRKMNIPFEVYAFSNTDGKSINSNTSGVVNGDLCSLGHSCSIRLKNYLSSKMTKDEYDFACAYLLAFMSNSGKDSYYQSLYFPSHENTSGTPLNSALLLAPELLNDFHKECGRQILHTIILTDGDATDNYMGHYGVVKGGGGPFTTTSIQDHVLTDKVTKKNYEVKHSYNWQTENKHETNVFIQRIVDRCDCKVIGFYVSGNGRKANQIINLFAKSDINTDSNYKKFYNKNNFVDVNAYGFTHYFIINSSVSMEKQKLSINKNENRGSQVQSVINYLDRKNHNKLFLNTLAEIIG